MNSLRPAVVSMEEGCASVGYDVPNATFSLPILMVGVDPAEAFVDQRWPRRTEKG